MGKWMLIDRFLIILASTEGLMIGVQHLETKHLKGERNQLGEFDDAHVTAHQYFILPGHSQMAGQETIERNGRYEVVTKETV